MDTAAFLIWYKKALAVQAAVIVGLTVTLTKVF